MKKSTKINVIIPTRERADVLYHCLRTVVAQKYHNLDIIVSDNFSQDNTKDIVNSFNDERIIYLNTHKRVSMSHNWEHALNHVKQGWVMFLGDDDGLLPGAIELIDKLIFEYNVEAIISRSIFFRWPNHFKNNFQGRLVIPLTDTIKIENSEIALEKVFRYGYGYNILPMIYSGGIASIDLINCARDKKGHFFCSPAPDVYSGVALAFSTKVFLSIGVPITVAGISKHGTGESATRSIEEKKDPKTFVKFQSEENIPYHDSIKQTKIIQLLVYNCYLQSWHIHHGRLGIDLKSQLQIALDTAPSKNLEYVKKECNQIALRNGLSFVDSGIQWKRKIIKLPLVIKNIFQSIEVNPKQLGIENVYDAAIASAYIYRYLKMENSGIILDSIFIDRIKQVNRVMMVNINKIIMWNIFKKRV